MKPDLVGMVAKTRRIEHNIFAYAALAYAILGGVGSAFKVPGLQRLVSDPAIFIPATAFFLFALARHALRVEDELAKLVSVKQLIFQEDIDNTYGSMWARLLSRNPKRVWATYLNPEAFASGEPIEGLKDFYERAEKLNVPDYRRVFGIYPDHPCFAERRKNTVAWLEGHRDRTRHLRGYQARFVELTFQVAEVLVDDSGLNFSFPSESATEAGWSTTDREIKDMMKDYFHQVWGRARNIDELFDGDVLQQHDSKKV